MIKFKLLWVTLTISVLASASALCINYLNSNTLVYLETSSFASTSWSMVLLYDSTSSVFLASVLIISSAVINFSQKYMESSNRYKGFHILVILFVTSMLLLIVSPNLFSGLLGWDGLGMVSYLLVIFYGNSKALNSGAITALTNRIGDILLISSLGILGSLGESNFFYLSNYQLLNLYGPLVLIALTTKSAQVPFSAWLPAAMAAPTPVSALVHSSTLVTAGVYLMIRHEALSCYMKFYLLSASLLTTWGASLMALYETDLKKIVALSTLSQLGLMVTMVASGLKQLAFLHLLAHAFFKAMTFIAVGSIIHSNSGYQDVRWIPSFSSTFSSFAAISSASASLAGIPFMSAFFTKELLLEFSLSTYTQLWIYIMLLGSIPLTAAYSLRLMKMTFMNSPKLENNSFRLDSDLQTMISMTALSIPAILGGWFLTNYMGEMMELGESSLMTKSITLSAVLGGAILGTKLGSPQANSPHHMWGLSATSYKISKLAEKSLNVVQKSERGMNSVLIPNEVILTFTSGKLNTVWNRSPQILMTAFFVVIILLMLYF